MRILVCGTIGESGLQFLRENAEVDVRKGLAPEELRQTIGKYDAMVVRSSTQITAELLDAAKALKVIGRAGTGVDNIDVEAATARGVLVVNAPTGNSNAVAEHTIALMLALARRLYPAVSSMKAGRWEKRSLQGVEVQGKTLGLVGLGRIGTLVASKVRGLDMQVMAYDPYISGDRAASIGVTLASLDEVLAQADFLSVHTPLTEKTRGMISKEELAKMKPSAYVLNCARGGIVDEGALKEMLQAKRLAGAALDVFQEEPAVDQELVDLDNAIATPHVGASTAEAQESVALDVAHAVIDTLQGCIPKTPVNIPYLPPQSAEFLTPYFDLAQRLGSFFIQWRGELSGRIDLVYRGELCEYDTRVITAAFLAGLLKPISAEPVNFVNSGQLADERGFTVSETCLRRGERYDSLIHASVPNGDGETNISGTLINGRPYLVSLDGQPLTCMAKGYMLVDVHHDRPGIVGGMGQILGEAGINISFAQMGRTERGGPAIMVLGLDEAVPPEQMPKFLAIDAVQRVRMVTLPELNDET